jgi:hypothetical protein
VFQATHRYIGIGAINGIAPGAKVVIEGGNGIHLRVRCADGRAWEVLEEYVVPLEVPHA